MEVKLIKPQDCLNQMLHDLEHGKEKGTTTYIDEFDQFWTWRLGEANIHTGAANEGKSKMIKFLSLIKSLEEGWKFAYNSPEDLNPTEFFDDMIHTISGKTTDKSNIYNTLITEEEYIKSYELIKDNFFFTYIKPPHNTIENAIKQFEELLQTEDIKGFVFDPLMKFQKSKNAPERIEEYSTYVVTLLEDFARSTNTSVHVVVHQTTPTKDESTKRYRKPSMYTVRGGGALADGITNCLFLQRPEYAVDKKSTLTLFGSEKIKNQKLVGIPGEYLLDFNRKTNRYVYKDNGEDLYNFNKWLEPPKTRVFLN
jgi:twinkle protein